MAIVSIASAEHDHGGQDCGRWHVFATVEWKGISYRLQRDEGRDAQSMRGDSPFNLSVGVFGYLSHSDRIDARLKANVS